MTRRHLFLFVAFTIFGILLVAAACSDDEAGEWKPVPDDDADDDAVGDDDDDDESCDCVVTEEQWQDLLDRCDAVRGAVYEMFVDPTAASLCEACDPCLVGCFQDNDYCSTPFVDCFWDCVDAESGR